MRAVIVPKHTDDGKGLLSVEISLMPSGKTPQQIRQDESSLRLFLHVTKQEGGIYVAPSPFWQLVLSQAGGVEAQEVVADYDA